MAKKRAVKRAKITQPVTRQVTFGNIQSEPRRPTEPERSARAVALSEEQMSRGTRKPKTSRRHVELKFRVPKGGAHLVDLHELLERIDDLALIFVERVEWNEKGRRPGAYVTALSLNSPLKINIHLFKVPQGVVRDFIDLIKTAMFYSENKRLKAAEAALAEERLRSARRKNTRAELEMLRELEWSNEPASVNQAHQALQGIRQSPIKLLEIRKAEPFE